MSGKSQRLEFTVEPQAEPLRLDLFISTVVPELSRSLAKRLADDGGVKVDGRQAKPSRLLRGGEAVSFELPEPEAATAEAEDIPLEVIYEDADIIVVNKPAGMVVHPAPGHPGGTLVNALLHHCSDLSGINGELRPGIVHRLDAGTTGALVAAKHDDAHAGLARQFQQRSVEKRYLALVFGPVKKAEGEVHTGIARDPGNRLRMAVVEGGREAVSRWQVQQSWPDFSLLSVQILTGRTHQIRVHCAYLGYPILGDDLYAGRRWRGVNEPRLRSKARKFARPALHAHTLAFNHPITGKDYCFEAPLPDDFARLLKSIEAFS